MIDWIESQVVSGPGGDAGHDRLGRGEIKNFAAPVRGVQYLTVKAYIGVTDGDWFRFLAERPNLQEVNFWRPSSDKAFRVLGPGEPFFFKTHHPHNRIVGGGVFSGFARLTMSDAWELYGEGNGVEDLEQMRRRIGKYRRRPIPPGEDPVIGCLLIRDVCFFPAGLHADPPQDFAANIVQGKSFDLDTHPEASRLETLLARLLGHETESGTAEPWSRPGPVYGDPRLTRRRLGQQAFQAVVLNAYRGRCAISGTGIRPVLQAAHIRPLPAGGEHRLDNGLLLRSDVHTLFDRGYLAVDPDHRLLVSPRLQADFNAGEEFYQQAGQPIGLPERKEDRPNREFLRWHLEEVFKDS